MVNERMQALAPDLRRVAPRSARAPLGPYSVIAARALDKCRAELAGRVLIGSFPLVMVPIFAVPLSIVLHLASLSKIRAAHPSVMKQAVSV
jgi:hypothetical protein